MGRTANLSHVILSNPNNGYEPYDNATPLPVTLSGGGGGGDATAANQATMITHLSDIEAAVEGTLLVSDSTAQSSLANIDSASTSLDGKVTACDTGNMSGVVAVSAVSGNVAVTAAALPLPTGAATSALQGTGNADLAIIAGDTTSLDSKVVACDTGSVAIASNSDTTKATSTLQTAGNASLSVIEGCAYQESDTIGASNKGVLVMGRDGANTAKPIHITSNGDVEVEIADFVKGQDIMANSFPVVLASDQTTLNVQNAEVVNAGSHANLANNVTINSGANSNAVSVANMNYATILYEDTATASYDYLDIEVSANGTDYFDVDSIYPNLNNAGTKRVASRSNMGLHGITHLRLKNSSGVDNYTGVTATIVGAP